MKESEGDNGMRLSEARIKKISKYIVLYVFILLAFIVPPALLLEPIELLQQNDFYIEWVGKIILIFFIINPSLCILVSLACSKWKANIFIVISLTFIAFFYITFKYMDDSALFYIAPYILIEGLTYFIAGRKKIRL